MNKHKIIAHRGVFDNEKIVENTKESFIKAFHYKYPVEFDVQLTTDNKLVVFHDLDLKRLAKRDDVVQEMDSSEVTRVRLLNTRSTIPFLKDVLELNKDHIFMDIEIKPTKRIKDTVYYLMMELDGYSNYVIQSFDPRIIRYIKKHYPTVQTGLLMQSKYDSLLEQWFLHTSFAVKYSKCDYVAISKKIYRNKSMMRYLSKYPIYMWTIKKKEEVDFQNNITYICNNLPYTKKD